MSGQGPERFLLTRPPIYSHIQNGFVSIPEQSLGCSRTKLTVIMGKECEQPYPFGVWV